MGVHDVEGVIGISGGVDVADLESDVAHSSPCHVVFGATGRLWSCVDANNRIDPLGQIEGDRSRTAAEVEKRVSRLEMRQQKSCRVGCGAQGVIVYDGAEVAVCIRLAHAPTITTEQMASVGLVIEYSWRGQIDNDALNALHADAFNHGIYADDWKGQTARYSLGWVTAHEGDRLVGFVNVPWDGGIHAWLQDVIVASTDQHRGIGRAMVNLAVERARAAGCEWLHVDFEEQHRKFYVDACGFVESPAGLIQL